MEITERQEDPRHAVDAAKEERLVALYMELTGASLNEARSVYAQVTAPGRPNAGVGPVESSSARLATQRQRPDSPVNSEADDENGLVGGAGLLASGTASGAS